MQPGYKFLEMEQDKKQWYAQKLKWGYFTIKALLIIFLFGVLKRSL